MKVGLIDIDSKIPNLALMKISAYYKQQGNDVEFAYPINAHSFDEIYASKVFTWSNIYALPEKTILGGSGFDISVLLTQEIEGMCPDYSLYGIDYSMGFLTRGCIRKCNFCIVPEKEGYIKSAADIEEFLRHDKAVLLDNNILASEHGLKQIEKIASMRIKIDFNQGLDARLIDDNTAKLLSKVKWLKPIRLACDNQTMKKPVERAINLLRKHGATPKTYFCYMLVNGDIEEAHERAMFLRGIGVDPFAQPYRPPDGAEPTRVQKDFARWVNHKAIFKSVEWENYKKGAR